jgi:hypothetical protein
MTSKLPHPPRFCNTLCVEKGQIRADKEIFERKEEGRKTFRRPR